MKTFMLLVYLCTITFAYGQNDNKVSTIDFVQILNDNKEEAIFYYENNWKVLRDKALEKNYIHSYQLLETLFGESEPFQLMLITTYANQKESDLAEERFDKLIAEKGPLRLKNEKKPGEFRKILYNKVAKHLDRK